MIKLYDNGNYPWRDSLSAKARCACCQYFSETPPTDEETPESKPLTFAGDATELTMTEG